MGDWQPLVNLVRVPALTGVKCVNLPQKQCMLSGSNLFLIHSVAADPSFADGVVTVPEGFVNATLNVPMPVNKTLYFKLRDDPAAVDSAVLPVSVPAERSAERAAEKAAERAAANAEKQTAPSAEKASEKAGSNTAPAPNAAPEPAPPATQPATAATPPK
jgi:hypothetical protein